MSANGALDATDRRILRILAADGRATLQAIAEQVGLRRASVHERVKRLEARGAIRGYRADLDPAQAGGDLLAFVLLQVERQKPGEDCARCCEGLAERLRRMPQVLEFHTLAASDDVLLKVRAADVRDLERLVMAEVSGLRGVGRVHTMVALRTHFERPVQVPEPRPAPAAAGRRRARGNGGA